ncbi:unnamed protein product [Agarophyton chilense]
MGQEQSSETPGGASSIPEGERIHFVAGTGNRDNERGEAEKLLERSRSLPIPQPLLPPAPPEGVSSALHGAQMMHELRSRIGDLISSAEEKGFLPSSSDNKLHPSRQSTELSACSNDSADMGRDEIEQIIGKADEKCSSVDEFKPTTEADVRAEQERWARLGLDYEAVKTMMEACTGGKQIKQTIDRQKKIMSLIVTAHDKSIRLKQAMNANNHQARRTTRAIESLDKLNVTLSEVQDSLESAVATANILGASHFAHDEEMCSFKTFLKHNPPAFPE